MRKLEKIKLNAAGIDIGSEKIFVAVEEQEVKSFRTFTSTLHQAVEYLQLHGVESVAIGSNGSLLDCFVRLAGTGRDGDISG